MRKHNDPEKGKFAPANVPDNGHLKGKKKSVRGKKFCDAQIHVRLENLLLAFDYFPHGVIVFDGNHRLIHVNKKYITMYRLPMDELKLGMSEIELRDIRRANHLPVLADATRLRTLLSINDKMERTEVWPLPDGRIIHIDRHYTENGGWIALHRDVTAQVADRNKVDENNRFLEAVLKHVPSAIVVKDATTGKYLLVNRAIELMNDWAAKDIIGKTAAEIFPEHQAEIINRRDSEAIHTASNIVTVTEEEFTYNGGIERVLNSRRVLLRDSFGQPSKLLSVIDDVTERRKAEMQMGYLSTHDTLTGIRNRAWFNGTLQKFSSEHSKGEIALVMLDLDGFKDINDSFGHSTGDVVLQTVATRMKNWCGEGIQAARLGGDEFAIIMPDIADMESLQQSLYELVEIISKRIEFENRQLSVGCSMGLAVSDAACFDPEDVCRQADMALYEAKAEGKGTLRLFDAAIAAKKLRTKALEMSLRTALQQDELELYYQPIVNAKSFEIASMEALLRWNHPEKGMVSPLDFIPLAESSGMIIPIGEHVIVKACEAAASWPRHIRVSVNISPVQFHDLSLSSKIINILKRTGLEPKRLELEITEATLLNDDSRSIQVLNELRAIGVQIAMDDFGTGYSSLNYIRKFPFDRIKIDKSYVDDMSRTSNKSNVILHAVLSMARCLNLATTAEGVETREQMEQLRAEGCTELQGYYFSKPVPEIEVFKFFQQNKASYVARQACAYT